MTKFPDLVAELLSRGYSDEDVRKVVGENLIRAFEKAEEVGFAHVLFLTQTTAVSKKIYHGPKVAKWPKKWNNSAS